MSGATWLVVIDMQVTFGRTDSGWFTPGYPDIEPTVQNLVEAYGDRVVFTRFIAPEQPVGAWVPYYQQWPFALVAPDHPSYGLMPAFAGTGAPVVSCTTFGKWGPELAQILGPDPTMLLAGVSTDCCVLSTALAAADAGVRVKVISDACAGLSPADHQRALDAMALYGPLIEVTRAEAVLDHGRPQ
jgi:nicotinamidase-related amidase